MIYELYETICQLTDSEANYTKEKVTQCQTHLVPILRESNAVYLFKIGGVVLLSVVRRGIRFSNPFLSALEHPRHQRSYQFVIHLQLRPFTPKY